MKRLLNAALVGLILSCSRSSERDHRTVYQVDSMIFVRDNCLYFTTVDGVDMTGCDDSCIIYIGEVAPVGADQRQNRLNDMMAPIPLAPDTTGQR